MSPTSSAADVAVRLPRTEQGRPGRHAGRVPPRLQRLVALVRAAPPHLPPSIRAIAVSLRGHGTAPRPQGGYGVIQLGGDVVALLDELGPRPRRGRGPLHGLHRRHAAWRWTSPSASPGSCSWAASRPTATRPRRVLRRDRGLPRRRRRPRVGARLPGQHRGPPGSAGPAGHRRRRRACSCPAACGRR